MRLNGWLRLWVSASVVALAVCAGGVASQWPSEQSIPDSLSLYDSMTPEARAQIIESEAEASQGVRMPNGHIVYLKAEVAASRKTEALLQYQAAVLAKVREAQQELVARTAIWWLGTSLAILVLGCLVAWVRAGFRATK